MLGAYYIRSIVFLDLWTCIFLSMLLPTSSIVSLCGSHLERNCISLFLIFKQSYLIHIKLHELKIFLQVLLYLHLATCQMWEHWDHPYWRYAKSSKFSVLLFFDRNIKSAANMIKLIIWFMSCEFTFKVSSQSVDAFSREKRKTENDFVFTNQ